MNVRIILGGVTFALLCATLPIHAQLSTSTHINFDGAPFTSGQSVNGLTVQNVLFEFFVNGVESGEAQVGPGPTGLSFFSSPSALSGPAGPSSTLVMTFLNPVWYFEFSLARNVAHDSCSWWHSTADVTVFGGFGQRTTTLDLWTEPGNTDWTVGEFTDDPDDDPVNYLTRAEIAFSGRGGDTFLLDEIEAEHRAISVPEPTLPLLLASGLLALCALPSRREAMDRNKTSMEHS